MQQAEKRLQVIARQLTSGGSNSAQHHSSSSFASATGSPSSYARIHGEASRAPADWKRLLIVAKEELVDVKYEKAEGIAKV